MMRKIICLCAVFLGFGFAFGQIINDGGGQINGQWFINSTAASAQQKCEDPAYGGTLGDTYVNGQCIDPNAVAAGKAQCEWQWWTFLNDKSCAYQTCKDIFPEWSEELTKCNASLQKCMDGGWAWDRCSCQAIWGIVLSTNVPFIGNCISMRKSLNPGPNTTEVTPTTAFPLLIGWATKIIMAITLVFCFIAIVIGGVRMSMGGADEAQYTEGRKMITHVIIALALMWASGVILRLINPNFFT